jgi:hypothetical protein
MDKNIHKNRVIAKLVERHSMLKTSQTIELFNVFTTVVNIRFQSQGDISQRLLGLEQRALIVVNSTNIHNTLHAKSC